MNMLNNQSEYVYNLNAITLSGLFLFLMLLFHAIYIYVIRSKYEQIADSLISKERYGLVQFAFYGMSFILVGSHLAEMFCWGSLLSITGLIADPHKAMFFAGSTYTTLGYGVDILPVKWELVTVIIALNGIVAFGWSTSVLVNMSEIATSAYKLNKRPRT